MKVDVLLRSAAAVHDKNRHLCGVIGGGGEAVAFEDLDVECKRVSEGGDTDAGTLSEVCQAGVREQFALTCGSRVVNV